MTSRPQVSIVDAVIGKGAEAIIARRPKAQAWLTSGNWSHLLDGWRGQLTLVRRRLVTECIAARLPLAEAQALRQLAASEYRAILDPDPQAAIGVVVLLRVKLDTSPTTTWTTGIVASGTQFARQADEARLLPRQAAEWSTVEDVYVPDGTSGSLGNLLQPGNVFAADFNLGGGNYRHEQYVSCKWVASRTGTEANIPSTAVVNGASGVTTSTTLFDPTFVVNFADSAGGSTGVTDADIRRLASALVRGAYGPTDDALVGGALLANGVRHVVPIRDYGKGTTKLFVADESWSASGEMIATMAQQLHDTRLGFGERAFGKVLTNVLLQISATVRLSDPRDQQQTVAIRASIRDKLAKYFDDRPDFFSWAYTSVASTICTADKRIMTCDSPTITDAEVGGGVIPASGQIATPFHYAIADKALALTFASA